MSSFSEYLMCFVRSRIRVAVDDDGWRMERQNEKITKWKKRIRPTIISKGQPGDGRTGFGGRASSSQIRHMLANIINNVRADSHVSEERTDLAQNAEFGTGHRP